jgi:hypothetical protein
MPVPSQIVLKKTSVKMKAPDTIDSSSLIIVESVSERKK